MPNIKIGQAIKIAGYSYRICHGSEYDEQLENASSWGRCIGKSREIWLYSKISQQELDNTIIHEVMHAINNVFNADEIKEQEIEKLATGLHQVLDQLDIHFKLSK